MSDSRTPNEDTVKPLRPPVRAALTVGAVLAAAVLVAVAVTGMRSSASLPDFRAFEAGPERKSQFFQYVEPLIEAENATVLSDRARLVEIADKDAPGWLDRLWLEDLAEDYGLEPAELDTDALIDALLRRVDAVPESLALAQAAKESGWGTSRFAREGNNLFGEWCYREGCGLVPRSRPDDKVHEVEAFDSPRESVASYVRNINTHRAYRELRRERARLREAGRPLSGIELADQLARYSERGDAYVDEIVGLIRYNGLETANSAADDAGD